MCRHKSCVTRLFQTQLKQTTPGQMDLPFAIPVSLAPYNLWKVTIVQANRMYEYLSPKQFACPHLKIIYQEN